MSKRKKQLVAESLGRDPDNTASPCCAKCWTRLLTPVEHEVRLCTRCFGTGGYVALLCALRSALADADDDAAVAILRATVRSMTENLIEEIVDRKLEDHRRTYEHERSGYMS